MSRPDDPALLNVPGGYRLSRRLGRGAYGEVWRAEAPGGVEVAVKIIPRTLKAEEATRELEALQIIRRLRHQNLLSLQAFFALDDRLIVVLELADCSLRQRLDAYYQAGWQGIPPAELLGYFREAAEALDYLHANNVQHRDVKPDNLLLLGRHVKVADCGLARLMERTTLQTASTVGTPSYMAPEVWGGKVTLHSDQYSLAMTYAELRLGRLPFPADNLPQLVHAHLYGQPELTPLPEPERQVLLRALAKSPEGRFANCVRFAEALAQGVQQAANPQPVPAAAPRVAAVPQPVAHRPAQPVAALPMAEVVHPRRPPSRTVPLVPPGRQSSGTHGLTETGVTEQALLGTQRDLPPTGSWHPPGEAPLSLSGRWALFALGLFGVVALGLLAWKLPELLRDRPADNPAQAPVAPAAPDAQPAVPDAAAPQPRQKDKDKGAKPRIDDDPPPKEVRPKDPPPQDDRVRLAWKFNEGDTFYVETIAATKTRAETLGQVNNQTDTDTMLHSYTVQEKTADGAVIRQKIEDAQHKAEGNPADPGNTLQKIKGAVFTLTVGNSGKVERFEGYDDFIRKLADEAKDAAKALRTALPEATLKKGLEDTFDFLPERPVKEGDSWKRETTFALGPLGSFRMVKEFTYEGKEGGHARIGFRVQMSYSAPAGGVDGGGFKIVRGELQAKDATGTLIFDPQKGRLVRSRLSMVLNGTLTVEAMGNTADVSLTVEGTNTVRVLDRNPRAAD